MQNTLLPAQELRNEPWFDTGIYPFTSHYLSLPEGKLHYIDEGSGEVILFVHGTPAWSFLYREQVKALSKQYRCIALDHLGFGLSDKPMSFEGSPQVHAQNLSRLIDHLYLDRFTLVVHDFGGPIGLSYAITHPGKVSRIVLLNTWLWETKNLPDAQKADRVIRSGLGRFLYLNMNFSPRVLLKKSFANKYLLTKNIHRHYTRVFPTKRDRYGLLHLAEALVGASGWYQQQWEELTVLEATPKLILWGTEDPFLKPGFLDRWKSRFPGAEVRLLQSGHFVQEECGEAVTAAIQNFMLNTPAKGF